MSDDYAPLTPVQTEKRMRELSRRLLEINKEIRDLANEVGAAKADYHEKYHEAHITSLVDHPSRKVDEHKAYAEQAAMPQYRVMVVKQEILKSARDEAHTIRQVLSSLQTNQRSMAGLMGESR